MRAADPRQLTIPFSRGEQLSMRREISLPRNEKFLLWIIDDHIGAGRSWTMRVEQLAEEFGSSLSFTYKTLNALAERSLVFWEDQASGRREFFICWENVRDAIDSPLENPTPARFSNGESEAPKFSNGELVFSNGESGFSIGESHIWNNAPPNDHLNAPSTPTPAENDRRRELMVMVAECGVGQNGKCVDAALSQGMTPEAVAAVVEHFRGFPGRWSPGVLFDRLTRPGASTLPPDQGWFGECREWTAAQRQQPTGPAADPLEEQFGPTVDAAADDELREVLETHSSPKERRELLGAIDGGFIRAHPEFRRQLLEVLARSRHPPAAVQSG